MTDTTTTAKLPSLLPPDMDEQLDARCLRLPEHMRDVLANYLRYGVPPGSFLAAVLSNDLLEACKRGDDMCQAGLADFIVVLANYAPIDAWGDRERVREWMRRGAELRREALQS